MRKFLDQSRRIDSDHAKIFQHLGTHRRGNLQCDIYLHFNQIHSTRSQQKFNVMADGIDRKAEGMPNLVLLARIVS